MRSPTVRACLLAYLWSLGACSEPAAPPDAVTLSVWPAAVGLFTGQSLTFEARGTGGAEAVWSVVEEWGGSITADGRYTAPPMAGTYHVRAVHEAGPFAEATVTVYDLNAPVTYYVSSSEGSDENPGLNPELPLKTLARASALVLAVGSRLLFRADDTFAGQLVVNGSGTRDAPLVIGKYGAGLDPVLSGSGDVAGGDHESVVLIRNQSHIEIGELKITNDRRTARAGVTDNTAYGIHVLADADTVMTHFRFHDITFERILPVVPTDFSDNFGNAILFQTKWRPDPMVRIDDVVVEDCFFATTGKVAISSRHFGALDPTDDRKGRNSDFIIRNNQSYQTGGSFAVPSRVYNVLVENNNIQYAGAGLDPRMANRGSGLWFFSDRNAVAQRNTVLHNMGEGDSYGLHTDYDNKHVLVQYNYTQLVHGGFVEILGGNNHVTYRYNVSVDDGGRQDSNTFWFSDYAGPGAHISSVDLRVYNNTVYLNKDAQGDPLTPGVDLAGAASASLVNNVVMVAGTATLGVRHLVLSPGAAWDGNLLFNDPDAVVASALLAADPHVVRGYPLFLRPGASGPDSYKLRVGSAALGKAQTVVEPDAIFPKAGTGIFAGITVRATVDFFGNPVDLTRADQNIGAYAGPGLDPSAADGLPSGVSFPDRTFVVGDPGAQLGVYVGQVAMTSPNRQIARYAITGGNPDDAFYIHEWTGVIRNRRPMPVAEPVTLTVGATRVKSRDGDLQNFVYETLTARVTISR